MNIEYEEFETIEDLFIYLASISQPMKNIMPLNSYKGYVCSFVPIGQGATDSFMMFYVKGTLDPGVYEFDINSKSYKNVNALERTDKTYFIVISPKRNTIADSAITNL